MSDVSHVTQASLAQAGMLAVLSLAGLLGTGAIAAYLWHLYQLIVLSR